ncbi:MAG: hypothetical protein P8174_08155 [Gemmatimonadota bacterium]
MHAIDTRKHASGTRPASTEGEAAGSAEVRERVILETPPERGNGRAGDDVQPDWLARPDLLRRRGRRVMDADPAEDVGIRLRRARRVFAPFTALPSLARPTLDLRSRRR